MSCGGNKRTYSFSSNASGHRLSFNGSNAPNNSANNNNNNNFKKKKKYNRTTSFVPPTKFLLGGNIRDPLNLNGLQLEEETTTTSSSSSRSTTATTGVPAVPAAATTTTMTTTTAGGDRPKTCEDAALPPLTDFLLGGNINDPLNLRGIAAQEVLEEPRPVPEATRVRTTSSSSAVVAGGVDDGGGSGGGPADAAVADATAAAFRGSAATASSSTAAHAIKEPCLNGAGRDAKVLSLHLSLAKKLDRKDKIVSPVVPQPYRPLKAVPFRQIITPDLGAKASKTPKFKEKNTRFQYGNYQRYYSYRAACHGADLRLEILEKHRDFFADKDVLDVGCNAGHVSFVVARNLGARSVTGVDIDRQLVELAKRNVQHYVNCPSPYSSTESPPNLSNSSSTSTTAITAGGGSSVAGAAAANKKVNLKYKCYPVSMPILYGPIFDDGSRSTFPNNVRFVHGNYVLESETMLQAEQPQYDTILCLSVTKWIHLNWGDGGLKLAFKRMYAQLKPGGILVLEPQSWDSYKRKKSLTETIWRNYRAIQLFPHHFDRYLLSSEVGFSRCHTLAVVNHQHKGFRRAIKVFKKPMPSVRSLVSPNGGDDARI